MTSKETIASWKWRITKSGHNQRSFCALLGITEASLSQYISEKMRPSLDTFDKIEGKLQDLGV